MMKFDIQQHVWDSGQDGWAQAEDYCLDQVQIRLMPCSDQLATDVAIAILGAMQNLHQ
jgi:hypothetical protein